MCMANAVTTNASWILKTSTQKIEAKANTTVAQIYVDYLKYPSDMDLSSSGVSAHDKYAKQKPLSKPPHPPRVPLDARGQDR